MFVGELKLVVGDVVEASLSEVVWCSGGSSASSLGGDV